WVHPDRHSGSAEAWHRSKVTRVNKNPGELVILGLNPKRKPREKTWTEYAAEQLNMYKDILEQHEREGASPALIKKAEKRVRDAEKWLEVAREKDIAEGMKRRGFNRKRNSSALGKARQLFSTFHGREPAGVFEMQRSARARKDYTILGPLVSI